MFNKKYAFIQMFIRNDGSRSRFVKAPNGNKKPNGIDKIFTTVIMKLDL